MGATTVGGCVTGGSLQGQSVLVRHDAIVCNTAPQKPSQHEAPELKQSPANVQRTPVGTCVWARNARSLPASRLTVRAEAIVDGPSKVSYISARALTDTGSERLGGRRMGTPASRCHNSGGDGTQSLQPNLAWSIHSILIPYQFAYAMLIYGQPTEGVPR